MKRIVLLLMFSLLCSMIVSCANTDGSESVSTTIAPDSHEIDLAAETTTSKYSVQDDIPELDFNGEVVSIMTRNTHPFDYEMGVEEANGELVNDAIYERNRNVEERLNINIDVYATIQDSGVDEINKLVMSGDDVYTIVVGKSAHMMELVVVNAFYNLLDLDYVDFAKPWWIGNLNEEMALFNLLYFSAGDITLSMIQYENCIFYNQMLYETYNIPDDIYELVMEGKWTIDKLAEISKYVSSDLNGDGVFDKNDLYGFSQADSVSTLSFALGSGVKITKKSSEGIPELAMNSDLTYQVIDKVYNLYYNSTSSYIAMESGDIAEYMDETGRIELTQAMFANNQVLFYTGNIFHMESFRDMESDYGILPFPKLSETQDRYITNSRDSFSMVAVPVTCYDTELAGAVLEAMASESYRTVTPIYFDIALKNKYSRDERTADMINIIHESVEYDFGQSIIAKLNYISHSFQNIIEEKSTDFASKYDSREPAAQVGLDSIVEAYRELK